MSRETVLVTGSSGFLGRQLIPLLLEQGLRVVAAQRDPRAAPAGVSDAVPFDLAAPALPELLLREVRGVVHLAAYLPSDYRDPGQARRCLELNALGTLGLVQSLISAQVPGLVNVSSGNIYRDMSVPATETAPVFPYQHAPYYLASKLVQEIYAEHLASHSPLRLVTLRPSAIYGPGMRGGMVHTFATRLLRGEGVVLEDGGRYASDLVYVGDVARVAAASLTTSVRGCFNIGSGERVTSARVAQALAGAMDAPGRVQIEPAGQGAARGFAALDISRARELLGFVPTPLEQGLTAYVSWLRNQA